MKKHTVNIGHLEIALYDVLREHGIIQNCSIRPVGDQIEIHAQLRPFDPDSPSEMELAGYRRKGDLEIDEDETWSWKTGLTGLRDRLRKRFGGQNEGE